MLGYYHVLLDGPQQLDHHATKTAAGALDLLHLYSCSLPWNQLARHKKFSVLGLSPDSPDDVALEHLHYLDLKPHVVLVLQPPGHPSPLALPHPIRLPFPLVFTHQTAIVLHQLKQQL